MFAQIFFPFVLPIIMFGGIFYYFGGIKKAPGMMLKAVILTFCEFIALFFLIFDLWYKLFGNIDTPINRALEAGVVEEVSKFITLLLLLGWAYRWKLHKFTDAVIGGALLGLIFALFENYDCVFNKGYSPFMRLLALLGHMVYGIIMGYYFSVFYFKKEVKRRILALFMALMLPITMHFIYDFSVFNKMLILWAIFIIWGVVGYKFIKVSKRIELLRRHRESLFMRFIDNSNPIDFLSAIKRYIRRKINRRRDKKYCSKHN